jgi:3-deoxy-manno-octulosonate cytidylyltransferase (CMP-KDO synthetase)
LKIIGIIPARFGSVRFPGKPLVNIDGKPMIQRVYEQCLQAELLDKVVVATDCSKIFDAVKNIGGEAVLTQPTHDNGTSRCAEAYTLLGETFDFVINIQGDEPFINPKQIDELCAFVAAHSIEIGTQIKKEYNLEWLHNPNLVKVITNDCFHAINFTRANIAINPNFFYKHIGLYAFRTDILKKIVLLPPSINEIQEKLEQLRWLDNGFSIHLQETDYSSKSIDVREDLVNF